MANDLTQNPFVVDTAATTLLISNPVYMKTVRWVSESSSAGDNVVIKDLESNVYLECTALGANTDKSYLIERWVSGARVTTLDSGKVYLEFG